MKKLLILGGSGFIGRSILDEFILGKLKRFNINKLILVSRNILKLKKNYKKKNIILKSLNLTTARSIPEADIIIHAAENAIKKTSKKKFKESIKLSNKITKNIIKILKNLKSKKTVIYLSSGAVYRPNHKTKKIKENNKILSIKDSKKNFRYLYGLNKIKSERELLKLQSKHNIIILRLFSFVGKRIPKDSNYILENIKKNIKSKKTLNLLSNNFLTTYRSFLSTNDLTSFILRLITIKFIKVKPIFNIGSDKSISLIYLVKKLSKIYKFKYEINKKQSNKIDFYVPNINKLKQVINCKFEKNTFALITNYLSEK